VYFAEEMEGRLDKLFRDTFGENLVVDRLGGSHVAFRCGIRPDEAEFGGRLSMPYAKEVRKLPLLDEQGDGMRSFVACLLHTEVLERPVVLIDEPEAFLHPPQARALARHLAECSRTQRRQFILATHSADIVRGTIDTGADVTVVRLTREGTVNQGATLSSDRLAELWKDPLLRASNLLDGLFHKCVVVCEGDADCRFYNAVLAKLCEEAGKPRPEVLFTHTGGKKRLSVAVRAMRAIQVPTLVVADMDILGDAGDLRGVWEALGFDWTTIEREFRIVRNAVDSTRNARSVRDLRKEIDALLDGNPGHVTEEISKKIRDLTKAEGGWENVKRAGVSAVPKGDGRTACDALLGNLRVGGLHVVPVGELEGFAPTAGGHGPTWLHRALHREFSDDARSFVKSLGLL
jgi:hypothetical protein